MDKKLKSFWMYTIILFTVALVIILLTLLGGKTTSDGYKSSIQQLQTEKEALEAKNKENDATIVGLNTKVSSLTAERDKYMNAAETYANAVESIYIADGYCDDGEYKMAKEELDKVDPTILKEQIRSRYDAVKADIEAHYVPADED